MKLINNKFTTNEKCIMVLNLLNANGKQKYRITTFNNMYKVLNSKNIEINTRIVFNNCYGRKEALSVSALETFAHHNKEIVFTN